MDTLFLSQVQPKTIYGADAELFSGGTLVLNETKQNYQLALNATQSLTIDTTQLSGKANVYTMTFVLNVVANGHYVINFQDCNIEQMEFYEGMSQLKFTKAPCDVNWTIEVISYAGIEPSLSLYDWNLRGEFCLATETATSKETPISIWMTSFNQVNSSNWNKTFSENEIDYYTFSLNPFTLTEFSVHYGTYSAQCPTGITVYGSNDFENWVQLYNNPDITVTGSTTLAFIPTIIRPFKNYKFHLSNGGVGGIIMPPISLKGIGSELLYAGYLLRFPNISAALNGYDVSINTEDGCANADSKTPYGAVNNNFISVTRPNQSTTWKVTYTYPEAVRPCCFFMQKWGSYVDVFPAWFAWYGSDDGTNWTKAVELRNILPVNTSRNSFFIYYPCDFGSSHKYWQFRCYATYSNPDKMSAAAIIPIVPSYQYAEFETIVPKLSADEQSGYTVSASSTTDGAAYKMYDGDSNTYCGGSISDGSWSTTINMGESVIIQGIQMRTTSDWNRMPTVFKVQGSNDGEAWTDISTQTPGSNFWEQNTNHVSGSFEFDNDTAYQYYRLYVTATAQGTYVRICDLGWTTKIRGNPIDYYTEEYEVPIMRSNSQDGFVCGADSTLSSNYPAWHAFDRNGNDAWVSSNGSESDRHWIKIGNTNSEGTISGNHVYLVFHSVLYAKNFTIQASNDELVWVDIHSVTGNTNQFVHIDLDQTYTYKFWSLLCELGNSSRIEVFVYDITTRTFYNS
ncbi:MAG: discoidin domain-containing protein [Bacteroidales bacterium]|nr:discoidin domain-containing protein [Bacteroidales bacterium]